MYVGLLSDTHGVITQGIYDFLDPVDEIWHAGDWGADEAFISGIRDHKYSNGATKPLVGVFGNCDGNPARLAFPEYQFFEREGMKVLLTHIGGSPGHYYPQAYKLISEMSPDLFVCGHSHILMVKRDPHFNLMYVNPGAAGIQGWHLKRTALRFRITSAGLSDMEVLELPKNLHQQ